MFYDRNNLLVNDLTNKKIYIYNSKFLFKNNYYNIKNENGINWFVFNILFSSLGLLNISIKWFTFLIGLLLYFISLLL